LKHDNRTLLTEGPIAGKLVRFALPFLGSSLIQQLYSTVDQIFTGQVLGRDASAAVGASGIVVTCLLGFFTGLGVGIGVLCGQNFGKQDKAGLSRVIHSAAGLALLCIVIVTAAGELLAGGFLRWMNTPAQILPQALVYVRIYFLCLFSIVTYNIGSGILRALGDSRTPMINQLAGGLLNVAADWFFLCVLHTGVGGIALATFLSQTLAALLTLRRLFLLPEEYRLQLKEIRLEKDTCRDILRMGIPSAVQSMIITFSNLLIQTQINLIGITDIAAFTAYFKVENFIYLPIMAISQANAVFISQNFGASKLRRMYQGMGISLRLGVFVTLLTSCLVLMLRRQAFALFVPDAQVVAVGCDMAMVSFPFYFTYVFLEVFAGTSRGQGHAAPPMLITVINMCIIRTALLFLCMRIYHDAAGIVRLFPVTWVLNGACQGLYLLHVRRGQEIGDPEA